MSARRQTDVGPCRPSRRGVGTRRARPGVPRLAASTLVTAHFLSGRIRARLIPSSAAGPVRTCASSPLTLFDTAAASWVSDPATVDGFGGRARAAPSGAPMRRWGSRMSLLSLRHPGECVHLLVGSPTSRVGLMRGALAAHRRLRADVARMHSCPRAVPASTCRAG